MDEGESARNGEGGHVAAAARELDREKEPEKVERRLDSRREHPERLARGEPGRDEDERERGPGRRAARAGTQERDEQEGTRRPTRKRGPESTRP